jgi:hypothetical protein
VIATVTGTGALLYSYHTTQISPAHPPRGLRSQRYNALLSSLNGPAVAIAIAVVGGGGGLCVCVWCIRPARDRDRRDRDRRDGELSSFGRVPWRPPCKDANARSVAGIHMYRQASGLADHPLVHGFADRDRGRDRGRERDRDRSRRRRREPSSEDDSSELDNYYATGAGGARHFGKNYQKQPQQSGPKKIWDGFQWVTQTEGVPASALTGTGLSRKARRLHFGNLPAGTAVRQTFCGSAPKVIV